MEIAEFIEHTRLNPDASIEQILQLCSEAKEYQFRAVCVNPCFVDLAAHLLKGSGVAVSTVVGFPLGASLSSVKEFETRELIQRKADEIDMVMNIGAAKAGRWDAVTAEIKGVVGAADGHIVKVIIETGLLTDDEKVTACQAILAAKAHFVKTSTGFGPGGATAADVRLLKATVGDRLGIKASGGIRSREQAEALITAGAIRLGTSSGVQIIKQFT